MAFARKGTGHTVSTDLNRWLQDNLASFRQSLPSHIKLAFTPGKELPLILADTGQLDRMILNLLANAADSMPGGGTISLSTQFTPAMEIPDRVPELSHENYVCLKVADTGSGMDLTTREHVFEPFYTTKDRGRGTGLGLPVVYGLMHAHNGCIDVESEVGVGTVVSLFFPVVQASAKTTSVTSGMNPSLRGSETLLVVEDEVDVSFFLETIFQSHGYRVFCAHDYEQGLRLFKDHKDDIDLVFSDIGLPKVDGITLCSELKALKPGLPIVLASGYSPKEFKERMNELGNDDFLAKPYQAHDILQSVRKVLDSSSVLAPA